MSRTRASLLPRPRTPRTIVVPPSVLLLVPSRILFPFCTRTFMYMYVRISVHRVHTYVHAHDRPLFGHYSRYVALSSSLPRFLNYSQTTAALCVLIPPGFPCSPECIHIRITRCNEASYYCRFAALRSSRRVSYPVHIPRSPSPAR